jgi:cold shock CspA family protein
MRGEITYWNDHRGFGFLRDDGRTVELFVHISAVAGKYQLRPAMAVEFEPGVDSRSGRPCAVNVRPLEGARS